MFRTAATMAVLSIIALTTANAVLADDDVAALVVDNGSGMGPGGFASISKDDAPDCRLSPAQFFGKTFNTLDVKQHRIIVCTKSDSNPALFVAFQAANTNKSGALNEKEFNAYKQSHDSGT
jgi:hypothetical protein